MRWIVVSLVIWVVAGCQAAGPSVSIEEARDLAISFENQTIQKPERSIDEYRDTFTEFATSYPNACGEVRRKRDEQLKILSDGTGSGHDQSRMGFAAALVRAAEKEFQFGNFQAAMSALDLAYSSLAQVPTQLRGIIQTQIARVETTRGRDDAARSALAIADSRYRELRTIPEAMQMFLSVGEALQAQLDQNIRTEEFFLRETIELQKVYGRNAFQRLDGDTLHARLVSNLILQNCVVEAEQVARSFATPIATRHARPGYLGPILTYRVFAEALLAQKRYEEAEFIARATLDLHYRHCSIPTGVPVIEAWRTLFKSLAGQGKWAILLKENQKLERDMAASARRYKQAFERNVDVLMARLVGTTVPVSRDVLGSMIATHEKETGTALDEINLDENRSNLSPDAVKSVELRLVRALSDRNAGNITAAVTTFDRYLTTYLTSVFTHTASVNDSGTSSRAEFFRNAYIDLLVTDEGARAAEELRLDRVRELYRVATTLPAGSVQQSFAAAATRASIPDVELASLIRESQDLEIKAKNLSDSLAFLETADDREVSPAKLRELRAQVLTFTEAAETLKQEANQKFPAYGALMNPVAPDLDEIRALLSSNETMLVTFSTDSRTLVWGIPKIGKIEFAVASLGRKGLERYVNRIRATLDPTSVQFIRDIPKFDTETAYKLYETILKPVEKSWSSADNILSVTPGPLSNLPLSLLPKSKPNLATETELLFGNYRNIDWLANDHAVTILPSTATLKNLRAAPSTVSVRKPFLGFGDPFFSNSQLAEAQASGEIRSTLTNGQFRIASLSSVQELPLRLRNRPETRSLTSATMALLPRLADTRDEIVAVAEFLGADLEQDVYLGLEASETVVKSIDLTQYRVVSFATHGLVSGDLDGLDEPALALTNPLVLDDRSDDGLLTMSEILGLQFNADWVVLSACNTASPDGETGEAISGLGRAFFYAGTKSILVSNWPVHSAATTALMTNLFQNYQANDNQQRSKSLQSARKYLIDEAVFADKDGVPVFSYAHPLFWAPFVVVGDN